MGQEETCPIAVAFLTLTSADVYNAFEINPVADRNDGDVVKYDR